MPIVDGLTSTKMIRSHEKTCRNHRLSKRAALNNRVPIIAVSASLVEKERQVYIDAGFDGWILKPIAFNRLSEIMNGLIDQQARRDCLYRPGGWEHGGWFDEPCDDAFAANTRPSAQPPKNAPGAALPSEGMQRAAAVNNPFVKEESESEQSREQLRLAGEQATEPPMTLARPELGDRQSGSSEETITAERMAASPQPIIPRDE